MNLSNIPNLLKSIIGKKGGAPSDWKGIIDTINSKPDE